MQKIARFIHARARLIIILVAILNIAALVSFFRFQLDTDFLSFFASENPRAVEYDRLQEKYGDGEAISVLIEQEGSLLGKKALIKVHGLQQEIEALDGVSLVESFIPADMPVGGRVFEVDERFIKRHDDILAEFIEDEYFLTEQFLTDDNSRAVIIVSLEAEAVADNVVKSLQGIAQNETDWTISLAGNEIIGDTLWYYLQRIIFILPPSAVCLILLVFFLILRKRLFTIIAIIPAGMGALWTIGTICWSGQEMNLVTVISPIFVIVMGAADGLHYTSHFMDNMSKYSDRRQLTVETMGMVGMPIFLTTITTMAGFASLTWTEVVPMRQMGIFVSLGIGYAGVLSLFFLPALLSRVKLPPSPPVAQENNLAGIVLAMSRHRSKIVVAFLAVVVISAVYIPRLEVVSNQLMFFKEESPIRQTFNKVEKYFGGALPLVAEIATDKGTAALRDYEFAEDILDAERELERLPGVQSAVSLFDMVGNINEMLTGSADYPQNPQMIERLLMQMDDEDLESWVSDDGLRMLIKTEDLDSLDMDRLEEFVADNPDIGTISGMPVLFDEMNRLVVESQVRSLGLALALIFIMLLITIRKLRAALVAMLPIIITIAAIMCMLSITGFHLNIMTANLSAIAVGVGVDYAIHLISGIYYFRNHGLGSVESVDSALTSLSRPILANAFGLAIGLSVLLFSPLRIHMQVSFIMWVAMVVSSTGALLLIPLFYSRGNRKSRK
jgi:predicted RND superfamily exporter protein